jgi:nitrile hydratase subunit beta
MNGPHDLGGQMGHGPVFPERDEPWFHADWEKKGLALTLAMGATGSWSIDTSRHARESLPPVIYLGVSYYEIWLRALVELMVTHGLVSHEELNLGHSQSAGKPVKRVLKAADVTAALAKGAPCDRPCESVPAFAPGDRVLCRNDHRNTHTRLPRYAHNVPGTIERNNGAFVFPDSNAHGGGESPIWCYSVRFAATDLWGDAAEPNSEVMLDLWEPYLLQVPS